MSLLDRLIRCAASLMAAGLGGLCIYGAIDQSAPSFLVPAVICAVIAIVVQLRFEPLPPDSEPSFQELWWLEDHNRRTSAHPSVNPSTGLSMVNGSYVDVSGTPYGAQPFK